MDRVSAGAGMSLSRSTSSADALFLTPSRWGKAPTLTMTVSSMRIVVKI
jgi:hypothetical protein